MGRVFAVLIQQTWGQIRTSNVDIFKRPFTFYFEIPKLFFIEADLDHEFFPQKILKIE